MIKILDQNTIDKIAAGEVIERPKSVVKELVENSIDSGADAVTAEIKDGGLSFIRITDNGCGIEKSQVPIAFMRHATSKLVTVSDLLSLSSLGFRGEALSSIAAVSQVELITREKNELTGLRYEIHGGKEISSSEIGCPCGTTFIVRNLFYNTPARKKYMKTPATEGSYIYDMLIHMALSRPDISFKLIMNGNTKFFTTGDGNLKNVIYSIYGRDICENLVPVDKTGEDIHLTGYIAKPCVSRGNRGFEDYFVNNRYIKTGIVTKAIEDAYRTFVMVHKYPFTVINYQVNPELTDVNIHPAKLEMKFLNEPYIYDFTYQTIRDCLLANELIPSVTPDRQEDFLRIMKNRKLPSAPEPFEAGRKKEQEEGNHDKMHERQNDGNQEKAHERQEEGNQNESIKRQENFRAEVSYESIQKADKDKEIIPDRIMDSDTGTYMKNASDEKYSQMDMYNSNLLTKEARKEHRLIGQLFKTYLLVEYENKLYIIDQHAAHEKVKFEELMDNYKNKEIYSQYLMPPAVVTLNAKEADFLMHNLEIFESLGYQIEHFGGNGYKLSAVPANLFGVDGRDLFIEFISSFSDGNKDVTIDFFIARLASMACKAAIKGNTKITEAEADALIDSLLKLENPYTCPHGRPTIISMSETEIDKKFKRIV